MPRSHSSPGAFGERASGDGWVNAPTGHRYWGLFGAAGLLAVDAERGVLLQHRVGWSHFGGSWALPGGAMHEGESPLQGALRESAEEAGVPADAVTPRFTHVFDAEVWRYTTVVVDVTDPFEPVISDGESIELAWVPLHAVSDRELHPSFEAAWPELRGGLETRPAVLVDAANVVGSVPDGWWKDLAGATARLRDRLGALHQAGFPAQALNLLGERWYPRLEMVVEGQASRVSAVESVAVTVAAGAGDDTIARRAASLVSDGFSVTVVTADRELQGRVTSVGASVEGPSWLLGALPESPRTSV